MRVLMWLRSGREIPGGHRLQAEKTAQHLRARGVDVTVSTEADLSLPGLTIVHGFGLSAEDIRECRRRGLYVCLSSIYCSRRWTFGLDQRVGGGFQVPRRLRLAAVLANAGLRLRHIDKYDTLLRRLNDQRLAFESADLLLPNSNLEAQTIRDELGVTTPMAVVPNGVDSSLFGGVSPPSHQREEVVLYVGRFEPHKNQLGLIRALRDRPYRLLLVGQAHPHHLPYRETCQREAGAKVEFMGEVPHDDLASVYRDARVHALPSWYETTGLASLEAAVMGCNVVSTDRGYAKEYFGSSARYCDPADARSIGRAVDLAMESPHDVDLRERILERFTWERAAEATLQAYGLAVVA